MSFTTFVGRSLLSAIFISGGVGEVRNAEHAAPVVDAATEKLPEPLRSAAGAVDSKLLVQADGAVMTAAAVGLALGVKPRFAAGVLAAQLIPVTAVGHRFWEKEEGARRGDKIHFLKNLSLVGGLMLVALGDTSK